MALPDWIVEPVLAADLDAMTDDIDRSARLVDAVRGNVGGGASQTTSGGTELNLARLAMPNVVLETNRLYQLDLYIINNRNTSATDEFEFRLRRDVHTTGPIVGSATYWAESGTSGRLFHGRILFSTTGGTVNLHLSVIRTSGSTGTLTVYYGAFGSATKTMTQLWHVAPSSVLREITV